jgi:hypothetical protein
MRREGLKISLCFSRPNAILVKKYAYSGMWNSIEFSLLFSPPLCLNAIAVVLPLEGQDCAICSFRSKSVSPRWSGVPGARNAPHSQASQKPMTLPPFLV